MTGRAPNRRQVIRGSIAAAAAAAAGVVVDRRLSGGGTADRLALAGAPGSFGDLTGSRDVRTIPVDGWGFGPGQAAYASAVAADGTVLVGTTPISDDQAKPTGTDMELGVFEPDAGRFTRLVVPSTTGRLREAAADPAYRGIGGGDVADITMIPGDPGQAVFVSQTPYFGWDTRTYGLLPTVGHLVRTPLGWRYDAAPSRTADDLATTLPEASADLAFPAGVMFPASSASGGVLPRWSRGAAAIARLPRSGHLVIAQYFGDGRPGGNDCGALLVVDPAGRVRAFWQYPPVTVFGRRVVVSPREVTADPTSAPDDERFVVISDSRYEGGATVPFTVQEFGYTAARSTIAPRGTAVRAAQDGTRMETACFGGDGTLYVARTTPDGLAAAPLAVYLKTGGERRVVREAPAVDGWESYSWGATCAPDLLAHGTARGGLVRSIVHDPGTGVVLVAGLDGLVQAVALSGPAPRPSVDVVATLDLRLDRLRRVSRHHVGLRRGCVDADRRVMWLPANQVVGADLTWPYEPFALDQWLYRVDLARMIG